MRTILAFVLAIGLNGCATATGVVPMGPDSYMISRQGGTADPGKLAADSMREGNAFCEQAGKKFIVVHTTEVGAGWAPPRAEIQFMCLNAGDPQLTRVRMQSDPNQIIEVRKSGD